MSLGALALTRVDATVGFDWGPGAPAASVPQDRFSVRWKGTVTPLFTQNYRFYVRSDDGARLWVNGQLIVDQWTDHAAAEYSGSIDLVAHQAYAIRLEYYEHGGDSSVKLSWSSPSQPKQIVPASQLAPTAAPLAVTTPFSLDGQTFRAGSVVTGTVTYTNTGDVDLSLRQATITARGPGRASTNYVPGDNFAPGVGATTLRPGQSLTLRASRAVTGADTPGTWTAFATYQDAAGAWHDGPPTPFEVAAAPTSAGFRLWHPPTALDRYRTDPLLGPIARQPMTPWIDGPTSSEGTVRGFVNAAAPADETVVVVVYGYPRGGYSAGGFPSAAAYLDWVGTAASGAGTAKVWWIVEPDALSQLPADLQQRAEWLSSLSQAVRRLKQNPNARVYIEAPSWLGADELASSLVGAGVQYADGFALGVSGFESTATLYAKGREVLDRLAARGIANKRYVVDTSRNGNGPLTGAFGTSAAPWLSRGLGWLNPPGRGAGLSPRVPTDNPDCAALLWIKGIGGSDGDDPGRNWFSSYFSTPAPAAGAFWLEYAQDVARHTPAGNVPN